VVRWVAVLSLFAGVGLGSASLLAAESGDVNGDGRVDAQDVRVIDAYLAGDIVLQDAQIAAADADRDGRITARDRDLLRNRLSGISVERGGERAAVDLQSADGGVVVDKATGRPLAGVEVSLPDEGVTVRTDSQGRFRLPGAASSGKILTARTTNYVPSSVTTRGQRGFQLELERASPRVQVLDDGAYHLGDNNYDRASANAGQFRLPARDVRYERGFELSRQPRTDLVLRIGSLLGVDTYQSVAAGQSRLPVSGQRQLNEGLRVFLNGYLVAQVMVNGDNVAVVLPRWMLRPGVNVLRLETALAAGRSAGVFDPGNLLGQMNSFGLSPGQFANQDYDDIEFAHLFIEEPPPLTGQGPSP